MTYYSTLLTTGVLCILAGVYMKTIKIEEVKAEEKESLSFAELERMEILNKRLEDLESVLLLGEKPLDKRDLEIKNTRKKDIDGDLIVKKSSMFKESEEMILIDKYEKEGKSISEISDLIGRNKGEVLLLQKLMKDYQN